jgi:hypothetical protein
MRQADARERPYFIWDYDITEAEFRAKLAGDNEHDTAWAIARLLEAARWDDIWKYVTLKQVRDWFPRLQLRREVRSVWEYAFSVWDQPDDARQHLDPVAT